MNKLSVYVLSAVAIFGPSIVAAKTLFDTLDFFSTFLNATVGLFITLAIVVFFWGLIKYLTEVGDKKSEGLQTMFWGIITIFVMVSVWGIIALLQNTFLPGGSNTPPDIGKPPVVKGLLPN